MMIVDANAEKPDDEPTKVGVWRAICQRDYWFFDDKSQPCGEEIFFRGQRQDYKFLACSAHHSFVDTEPKLEYVGV